MSIASALVDWIGDARKKLVKLKNESGMTADSPDKFTRERWELVQGKIYVLDCLQSGIPAFVESLPANLTGEKSILSDAESRAALHDLHAAHYRGKDDRAALIHESKAKALRGLLGSFSGSAGTQPKTSEEAAESGPCLETPLPNPSARLNSLPGKQWIDFASKLLLWDVETLSEVLLDELERRNASPVWAPVLNHSGVGEGDSGLPEFYCELHAHSSADNSGLRFCPYCEASS